MDAEPGLHVLMTADGVGGVWSHALQLAAALHKRGARVSLATMGAPLSAAQRAQALRVPALALHESAWRLEWMEDPWDEVRRAGEWLLALEAQLRPDLVHLNQFAFGALPFVRPKLVVAHSCVLSWWQAVHGEPAPAAWDRYREVVAAGLAGADRVAAPTAAMRAALAAHYGQRWARACVVLPNGRSSADFAPGVKQPLVVSAGRLWDAAKNLQTLAAAAPGLAWPVRVVGPVEPPAGARGGPAAAPGVHWLGQLAPAELAAQLSVASIYAHPARYEPFGQSVLEAGLSGCALVLGDLASLREIWRDAALYVPPDDARALRAALAALIACPGLLRTMGRKARQRALHFSPARMAAAYMATYGQLLAAAGAGRRPPAAPAAQGQEAACAS
jgi:glycosyltransferase involved in cell wall biosynthesis